MKILFTGAHFTPAQAVIEELQKKYQISNVQYPISNGDEEIASSPTSRNDVDIVYIGRKTTIEGDRVLSVESQVLPKLGVKFIPIVAGRVRRIWDFRTLIALLKIPVGFIQSFYIVAKENPDVVVSFGGYVGVPVVFSAWLLNKPIIVHEQTLISGLANSISNWFTTKVAVSFDTEYSFDKEKLVLTGNPMRQEVINPSGKTSPELKKLLDEQTKQKKPLIFITGGNQGAHTINEVVEQNLDLMLEKYFVVHQTGDSKFQDYERLIEKKHDRYLVQKWFDAQDVGSIFQNADLVVSRAGINTLLELAYFGIPTIIIPLPYVLKDEQTHNAKFFAKHGLGEVLLQKDLTPESLLKEMNQMTEDYQEYKEKAGKAKEIVITDASQKLVGLILDIKQIDG